MYLVIVNRSNARPKKDSQLQHLIKKYCEGKASAEEIEFLDRYYQSFEKDSAVVDGKTSQQKTDLKTAMEVEIMARIISGGGKGQAKVFFLTARNWVNVAVVTSLVLIAGLVYFYIGFGNTGDAAIAANNLPLKNDVAPGGNRAVLMLADGSHILLDSAGNGALTRQGNVNIIKLNSGELAYAPSSNDHPKEVLYNTISTPMGGQYQLILSDGTKVWLNAASSLRFPAKFSGDQREVELTGEGYFEVTKNKEMPFRVHIPSALEKTGETVVEVWGTHFNVNAYADENFIRTTLLEGSVKVTKGKSGFFIVPGEQAKVDHLTEDIQIKENADLSEVVAWKNGLFQFDQAGIKTIMRQIARWYNVEVVYERGVPDKKFDGKIYRNVNASEVFKILEEGGIHIQILGKKVIVSP